MATPYEDPGDPIRRRLALAMLKKHVRGSDALRGMALELSKVDPHLAAVYADAARQIHQVELNLKDEFEPTEPETKEDVHDL